jgi:uncharacterized protein YkwD
MRSAARLGLEIDFFRGLASMLRWLASLGRTIAPAGLLFVSVVLAAQSAIARDPTNEEQLMVELVNRMRMNPQAELAKLVNLNLVPTPTFGSPKANNVDVANALDFFQVNPAALASQWSTLTPVPPVAWNGQLAVSAQTYSNVMLTANAQAHNLDSHKFEDGSPDIIGRIEASGYTFQGDGGGGESIFAFAQSVDHAHAAFAIDWGSNPPSGIQSPAGHRDLIMHPEMREIGIGIINDPSNANQVGPKLVTQHYAFDSVDGPFLTGVVYDENNGDSFYTPGEGLGGVTILAKATNGLEFRTTTFASGGYTLDLNPNLSYTITASGPGLGQINLPSVGVGLDNVKRDFIVSSPPLVGDANMDGLVNRKDVAILSHSIGRATGALWGDGDFNFDGRVGIDDLALLQAHLSPAGSPGVGPSAVPEPSSLALCALGAISLAAWPRARAQARRRRA